MDSAYNRSESLKWEARIWRFRGRHINEAETETLQIRANRNRAGYQYLGELIESGGSKRKQAGGKKTEPAGRTGG